MLILGMDTATLVCSVALVDEDSLLAEYTLNVKRTHSQRLMPLVDSLLSGAGVDRRSLDGIAVACGPGSFTGLRIGVATARGLAQGLGIPVAGVVTLDALADAFPLAPGLICPILDARRSQVYAALYRAASEGAVQVRAPAALSLEELLQELWGYTESVLFLGDAVPVYGSRLRRELGERFQEAPAELRINRGALVARRGLRSLRGSAAPAAVTDVRPFYLRPSDAERRLAEKQQKGEGKYGGNY